MSFVIKQQPILQFPFSLKKNVSPVEHGIKPRNSLVSIHGSLDVIYAET